MEPTSYNCFILGIIWLWDSCVSPSHLIPQSLRSVVSVVGPSGMADTSDGSAVGGTPVGAPKIFDQDGLDACLLKGACCAATIGMGDTPLFVPMGKLRNCRSASGRTKLSWMNAGESAIEVVLCASHMATGTLTGTYGPWPARVGV